MMKSPSILFYNFHDFNYYEKHYEISAVQFRLRGIQN